MTPAQLAKLTTEGGRPVITLMSDPSQVDSVTGQTAGFLSLVGAGANLRTIAVAKAEGDGPQVPNFTAAHGGTGGQAATAGFWRGLFAPLFDLAGLVTKALGAGDKVAKEGEPVTFDAALAVEALNRARWQASDALWEVIGNIMEDATIVDKRTAIGVAIDQFRGYVLTLVDKMPVIKAEDAVALSEAMKVTSIRPSVVAKAGKVISATNMDTLAACDQACAESMKALEACRAMMATLMSANDKAAKAVTTSPEASEMDPAKLAIIANLAAESAIKAAKSAGVTDAAKLATIGADASMTVFKAAVMGPPQPALPTGELPRQLGQGSAVDGSMNDPEALISAVVGRLGPQFDAMVAKAVAPVRADVDQVTLVLKGDEARVGVIGAIEGIGATVAKMATTPNAPRAAGEPETARKGADKPAVWSGSVFDFAKTHPG